jgi:hypothetical protein
MHPEADETRHHGTASPTVTGSHHPEPTEAPELEAIKDGDHTATGTTCDDD